MNRIIISGISLTNPDTFQPTQYLSNDDAIPADNGKFHYPVCSYLKKNMRPGDKYKVILLVKKDDNKNYEKNIDIFKKEMEEANTDAGAEIEYASPVYTDFKEELTVHEQLMDQLIDRIEDGDHIIYDMTYGPKDQPIVVFTALNFAEKYLGCEMERIIYGQITNFDENHNPVKGIMCDMAPLFSLSSILNLINSDDPEKSRKLLKSLLSV